MADINDYLSLIPSENASKQKFVDTVTVSIQGLVDEMTLLGLIPADYDIDTAVGSQLDVVGQWVGLSRRLKSPIAGAFFSLDTDGLGFDQGVWLGPDDSTDGIVTLDDATYRFFLYIKVAANIWDGSMGQLQVLINDLFGADPELVLNALYLPGGAGNYVSKPDAALASSDVRLYGNFVITDPASGSDQCLYSKFLAAGNQRTFKWVITAAGNLDLKLYPNGTAASVLGNESSMNIPVSLGDHVWLMTTLDINDLSGNRVAKHYYSTDSALKTSYLDINWVQIGVDVITPGTGFLFDSTAEYEVGSANGGADEPFSGEVYYLAHYGGLTGSMTVWLIADFRYLPAGTTSWTGFGWNFTLHQSGGDPAAIIDIAVTTQVFVIDNFDMSMTFAISGKIPPPLYISLLKQEYIPLRPAAVKSNILVTSVDGAPLFGFDSSTEYVAGFDIGTWGTAV